MLTIAIAYHSGYGHTARQASAAAEGVESVHGAHAHVHDVTALTDGLWSALAAADGIIFGSPTYMASPSAAFQTFAEASSRVWQHRGWQDKIAAGFTNSAGVNGDKLNTLTSIALLAAQHGMHWVSLGLPPGWLYTSTGSSDDLNRLGGFLGAMAHSPSDLGPDVAPADADLRTAHHLGRRVAQTAVLLRRGRLDQTAATNQAAATRAAGDAATAVAA
jgi:NAD(P)H dehydrogenase (quinone)